MSIVPGRIVEISGAWPGRTPKLPSVPGTTTISTSVETISRSGVTSSNSTGISAHVYCLGPREGGDLFRCARDARKMGPGLRRGLIQLRPSRLGRHLAGLVD